MASDIRDHAPCGFEGQKVKFYNRFKNIMSNISVRKQIGQIVGLSPLNVLNCRLPVIMWFLFGEVSSSSGCLGWATLFYCGTP